MRDTGRWTTQLWNSLRWERERNSETKTKTELPLLNLCGYVGHLWYDVGTCKIIRNFVLVSLSKRDTLSFCLFFNLFFVFSVRSVNSLFLTARPWAERGSRSTRGLLLTAPPWAERGSRFTRGLFIYFFVGDQTQTSARPNFESRNVWFFSARSC